MSPGGFVSGPTPEPLVVHATGALVGVLPVAVVGVDVVGIDVVGVAVVVLVLVLARVARGLTAAEQPAASAQHAAIANQLPATDEPVAAPPRGNSMAETVRTCGSAHGPPKVNRGSTVESVPYHRRVAGMGILVVEDDERIGESLARVLGAQGYAVTWTRTGADALAVVDEANAIVILDLGLPDRDGIEVCRELRRRDAAIRILILTARRDEVDVVVGLDAGADDYIVKPFSLAELLARIRAAERRDARPDRLVVGDLDIGVDTRRVFLRGEPVELSVKEFDLLTMLARDAGEVVRRTDLLSSVWDEHWFGSTKTLDTHVWLLRRKLDREGEPSRISTVRGVGYRLETL